MKNLIVLLLVGVMLTSCSESPLSTDNFSIHGTFSPDYSGMAYLTKRVEGEFISVDSTQVENNTFTLTGNIEIPEVYYLNFTNEKGYLPVFVEEAEITLSIPAQAIKETIITGSASQDEYDQYLIRMSEFETQLSAKWQAFKDAETTNDQPKIEKLEKELNALDESMQNYVLENAKTNKASVAAAYALYRNSYYFDENDLGPIVDNFDASISNSTYVVELTNYVNTLKKVAIGNPAVDFTMTDTEGQEIVMSSQYGKYLLVDFWASWCGPCRRENPNVVLAYETYKDKGFDVFGVSFDSKKDDWLKAIDDDQLTWKHVGDLKGWGNAAGKLYGIRSIPSNMLLDPEGIIIAKNLREEDLQNKLAEIFSN